MENKQQKDINISFGILIEMGLFLTLLSISAYIFNLVGIKLW